MINDLEFNFQLTPAETVNIQAKITELKRELKAKKRNLDYDEEEILLQEVINRLREIEEDIDVVNLPERVIIDLVNKWCDYREMAHYLCPETLTSEYQAYFILEHQWQRIISSLEHYVARENLAANATLIRFTKIELFVAYKFALGDSHFFSNSCDKLAYYYTNDIFLNGNLEENVKNLKSAFIWAEIAEKYGDSTIFSQLVNTISKSIKKIKKTNHDKVIALGSIVEEKIRGKNEYKKELAWTYDDLGIAFASKFNHHRKFDDSLKSINCYELAVKLYKQIGQNEKVSSCFHMLSHLNISAGKYYRKQVQLDKAIFHFQEALKYAIKNNEPRKQWSARWELATLYRQQGQTNKSNEYYREACKNLDEFLGSPSYDELIPYPLTLKRATFADYRKFSYTV